MLPAGISTYLIKAFVRETMNGKKESIARHSLFVFFACILCFASACSPDDTGGVQSNIYSVENCLIAAVIPAGNDPSGMSLADRMQHYLVPGVSLAVVNNGEIEWAKGYGVMEAGGTLPVTPDTVFPAHSVSKPVSVTGIMLLAQSGAIDISRNVNGYLTSWRLPDNSFTTNEKATIERLMSHTGGTNVSGFLGYPEGSAIPSLLQVLDGTFPADMEAVQVVYEPGSVCRYSGGGTV